MHNMKFIIEKLEFGTENLTELDGRTTPDGQCVFRTTASVVATGHGITLAFAISSEVAAAIEQMLQGEITAFVSRWK